MVLDRFLKKRALGRHRPGFRSRFGGLWTDRDSALSRCEQLHADGKLDADVRARLRTWIEEGYAILPQAVPDATIDRINAEIETGWARRDPRLRIELGGAISGLDPAWRARSPKLLDFYVHSQAALQAAFQPALTDFLRLVFDDDPLLFQSLSFEYGSQQAIHQDTAYVVVDSPMELVAAWIALEDVRPGSGELTYYPGSHRFQEHLFGGRYRNWNRDRDGERENERYLASLHEQARAAGCELTAFLPKKGDIFVWSADLAHGGAAITDAALTRKSFVCHYCPAHARPYYFTYARAHRTRRSVAGGGLYASKHFLLDEPRP